MLKVLLSLFNEFVKAVIVDYSVDYTKDNKKKVLAFLKNMLSPKYRYYSQLRVVLSGMPFIYKDFDAEVMKDFQDININNINIELLKLGKPSLSNTTVNKTNKFYSEFNQCSKIIIFGSAGYGKSTFLRHITLCIINKKANRYLNNIDKFIPIFIQLKAIKNHSKSPILNYLFEENPLFGKKHGV